MVASLVPLKQNQGEHPLVMTQRIWKSWQTSMTLSRSRLWRYRMLFQPDWTQLGCSFHPQLVVGILLFLFATLFMSHFQAKYVGIWDSCPVS